MGTREGQPGSATLRMGTPVLPAPGKFSVTLFLLLLWLKPYRGIYHPLWRFFALLAPRGQYKDRTLISSLPVPRQLVTRAVL